MCLFHSAIVPNQTCANVVAVLKTLRTASNLEILTTCIIMFSAYSFGGLVEGARLLSLSRLHPSIEFATVACVDLNQFSGMGFLRSCKKQKCEL